MKSVFTMVLFILFVVFFVPAIPCMLVGAYLDSQRNENLGGELFIKMMDIVESIVG